MNCIDCGHPLRPRGVKLADAKGTHKEQPGPRCSPCYKKTRVTGRPRATKCVDCSKPLRPRDTSKDDYPGTILHWGQGRCHSCWRAERGYTKSRRANRPTHCLDCAEPLRPNHTTLEDHPGTVRHTGNGVCVGCLVKREAAAREPVWAKQPDLCNSCAEPLRPSGTTLVTHPGTKEHHSHGVCSGCLAAVRRRTQAAARAEETATDPSLLRMLNARRERQARQAQAQRIRAEQEAVQRRFIHNRRNAA